MPHVIDYGQIQKAVDKPDGSKSVYMRIAAANRPMLYLNSDGTTRKEYITRDDLFAKGSIETMKMQVLTLEHPNEDVTPDNYNLYAAGSVGNIIAFDGDYMGVVASIRSRDALAAYDSGVRQVSPGYKRDIVKVGDSTYRQINRVYNHLSLVPAARGGIDIKVKDSLSDSGLVVFDASQIDDDMVQLWGRTTDQQDLLINRLLRDGELNPAPIDLSYLVPMTTATITIGGKALVVDSASADEASKLSSAYDSLAAKAAKADKLLAQLTDAEATNIKLKAELDKSLADSSNIDSRITDALTELSDAKEQLDNLKAKGVTTDAAEKALSSNNINDYKVAIVKAVSSSFDPVADAAEVDARYKQILDSFSGSFFPELQLENLNSVASKSSGTLETAKRGISNGSLRGLPSDAGWE